MVEEDPLSWEEEPPENFLDVHLLYRGVKKFLWAVWDDLDKIYPNFFTVEQTKGGLSVDWSKHSSPEEALDHLPGLNPNLSLYGIAQLSVGKLRESIEKNNFLIGIKHDPIRIKIKLKIYRGHSLLTNFKREGKNKIRTRIRVELSRIAEWAPDMKPVLNNTNGKKRFNHSYI